MPNLKSDPHNIYIETIFESPNRLQSIIFADLLGIPLFTSWVHFTSIYQKPGWKNIWDIKVYDYLSDILPSHKNT
jgi:hypothetical protein